MNVGGSKMKKWVGVSLLCMALAVAGCGGQTGSKEADKLASQKITVSAAASLQNALNEVKANYISARHLKEDQIAINYGASGALQQQIEQGAPASLFISASEKNMDNLAKKNLVEGIKPFTTNSLVLITPAGKDKLTIDQLTANIRLAIGEPKSVPAGMYAKQVLDKKNIWSKVEANIVYAKDVRAVLAYISQGAADAGFVYKTDAMEGKDKVIIVDTAAADTHDAIIYPIGIVSKNKNELTTDFYNYLLTDDAQKVLEKYGFTANKVK